MTDFTNEIKFLDTHDVDLLTFSTNVAGTTFIKNSSKVLDFLKNKVSPSNIILKLIREPENEFDEYAVRVDVSVIGAKTYTKLGYVPKDKARLLSYVLLNHLDYGVDISNISVVGGDYLRPNIGVFFDYKIHKY